MGKKDLRLVNTPNNIAKGRIEIDAQINKIYYNILNNIQRDNKELIIKTKKGEPLTQEQEVILNNLDTMGNLRCRISREELANILQRKNDRTKEEIDKRFNALQTAIFKFTTGEKSSTMVQLIGAVEEDDYGYTVNLDAKLYKYLFYNVNVGYTPINLATLFSLTGQYAQALYVLLRSWTGTKKKEIEFTIDELREYFKIGDKYKAYKNFKARVIIQAIEEINKTGSMIIEDFKEVKKGRSINSIIFIVNDLEPRQIQGDKKALGILDSETLQMQERNQDPIEWVNGIMVADERTYNTLDAMYGEIKHGLGKNILKEAYLKFIRKDKNCNTVINAKGISFYILLAEELFREHEKNLLEDNYNQDFIDNIEI
jgi:plasmid replication initiation protein